MTPIDEAALKADPSDSEIMEIAGRWFHTGENQHRADGYYDRSLLCWFSPVQNQHKSDGYYYRSLGTPTNVRGSDLIAFARALLHRSQPVAVVPAEQAEDSAMLDWLEKNLFERKWGGTIGAPSEFYVRGDFRHTTQKMRGETLREAIRAAMSNREAGGS